MARLIPESAIENAKTDGERKLLRLLVNTLDDTCWVWYEAKLPDSVRPDVLIYVPEIGLVLYEVKDWTLDNVISANADTWEVRFGNVVEKKTNPLKSAKNYFYNLSKRLKAEPLLLSNRPEHRGQLKLPVATAVVFPNIIKDEYVKGRYDETIDNRFVLFKNDLNSLRSAANKVIIDKLKTHFSAWWPNDELDSPALNSLRAALYPEITSQQKDKGGAIRDIILDSYQENVARKMGSGHNIVRGIAGSGKSLVLCANIRFLLEQHPDWKILLTCYNVALASLLRYYLNSFACSSGDATEKMREQINSRVNIVNFHRLLADICRQNKTGYPRINEHQLLQTASFQNLEDHEIEAKLDEMRSVLEGQTLQQLLMTRSTQLYDAILIDESQDFHPSWLKAIMLLLNGKTNSLLLAEDPNQKIYPRSFTYKETGINAQARKIYPLPIGYRSTREIVLVASKLVQTSKWDEFYSKFVEDEAEESREMRATKRGSYPKIIVKSNYEDICEFIVQDIKAKLGEGYTCSDIGILYLTRTTRQAVARRQLQLFTDDGNVDYVNTLNARLLSENVPTFWLSRDQGTKANYDQFKESVTISTIFSAKGLEFEIAYLVGAELYPWPKRNARENASLMYVGMTRSKSQLYILSTRMTPTVTSIEKIINEISIQQEKTIALP